MLRSPIALALLATLAIAACGRTQVFPRRYPDGGPIIGSSGGGGNGAGMGGSSGLGGGSGIGGGSGMGGGTAAACTPATCSDGCCDGSTCVRFSDQSVSKCGLYAQACKACPTGGSCSLGYCRSNPCNPNTCKGCCNTDICSPGTFAGSCGSNTCRGCTTGTACINQMCTPTGVKVGDPCTSDSQCALLGIGAMCKLTTTSGSGKYTGGFCTLPCYGAPTCPVGAGGPNSPDTLCLQLASGYGEADVFCSPECSPSLPCRAGYACNQNVRGVSVCWISPLPPIKPGTLVGSPCISDVECSGLTNGFCILEQSATFGNTGYRGGYCTSSCQSTCPDGVCVTETFPSPVGPLSSTTCKSKCTGSGLSSCRIGYTCNPLGAGAGWCGPNCVNGGVPCPAGKVCNPASGYCI